MMHDLVGRPYRRGAQGAEPDGAVDCWGLVRLACQRLHGTMPPLLPESDRVAPVARGAVALGWHRVRGPLHHGDVLVMRTARQDLHTGVVLRVRHGLQVLHADQGGSVLQPLSDLPLLGFHALRGWRRA